MCGIVGIAGTEPVTERRYIEAGAEALRHRGPDDAGVWWSSDGRVGFGHRRLAIIDLSPAGHQPMQDARGDVCIVFNGEIYNHVELRRELISRGHAFASHSDTEAILHAYREWGTDCLARLDGMFAFAIYDKHKQRVFLARDRAGEKPLYYTWVGGVLRFASEIKGILADPAVPRVIDPDGLECFLAMGYVPGERCILRGFHKLPPAEAAVFDLSNAQLRTWRYWRAPSLQVVPARDEIALLDELEVLLASAVRRQLVADVPVGVLLSGGVDSSLVTALAVRACAAVKTFTIRLPGYGEHDETEHARLIARHFGTDHVELDAGETTVDVMPLLARQFDEPMADSSAIPTYLVCRMTRAHCTVALGGDGGDELFGGYAQYHRLLTVQRRLRRIPRGVLRRISRLAERALPVGFRGRALLQGLDADWRAGLPTAATLFDRRTRRQLLGDRAEPSISAEEVRAQRMPAGADIIQRATRMDFEGYLPEDCLVKVDRTSMLSALEVRAPMLDRSVVEFAFGSVPTHLKATASDSKILLKRLARRLLPPTFDLRRKQGFSIPLAAWLRIGPWRDAFHDILAPRPGALFDPATVSGLLAGQARSRSNSERLYALVMFELWRNHYKVACP